MGSCIICGVPVEDGYVCDTHQEDVAFEFRGDRPAQLIPGRFYRGTVDGYADFGVFIDLARNVTGLLHRSELDRRLESLDWDEGEEVYVQVKNVRDNGNIDLGWSIRQSDREFRGSLVHDGENEWKPGEEESDDESSGDEQQQSADQPAASQQTDDRAAVEADRGAPVTDGPAPTSRGGAAAAAKPAVGSEQIEIDSLADAVGDPVQLEGEIVSVHQTGGPTVFELRDETGVVDCAAFVEAGVRAYPEIDVGDFVRLSGEVERRRGELQVETDSLVELDGDEIAAVEERLADALSDRARPDGISPLAGRESVIAVAEDLLDAGEAIRRAVIESRPIVVRHAATADGYVAAAAIERAALPLIRDEHERSDAEYHYFKRRPLDDVVYSMDAATTDVTRMLQDRDRHDEKLPLFLFVGTGSTAESTDGLEFLSVYDVERVVIDAAAADAELADVVDAIVNPALADADATDLSTTALAANLAAATNEDVREDVSHLPAISYWENPPEAYLDLAAEIGYDRTRVDELREAIALEAYYQSYEDKRELVTDLLFDDAGGLAAHISEQFREKLETELATARENVETESHGDLTVAVLDTDAYTHRFDFPPTSLLLDALHRELREDDVSVTIGVGMDELFVRSTDDLDIREIAAEAAESAPKAAITAEGVREGRIEFLAGERDAAMDAIVDAIVARSD
ncbi:DHH family phosphoesterase [Haloferacaceae archaeon DSL9]